MNDDSVCGGYCSDLGTIVKLSDWDEALWILGKLTRFYKIEDIEENIEKMCSLRQMNTNKIDNRNFILRKCFSNRTITFTSFEVNIEKLIESLQIAALLLSCASFGILILSVKSIERTVQESDKLLLLAKEEDISWEITAADGIFSVLVAFNSKLIFISVISNTKW